MRNPLYTVGERIYYPYTNKEGAVLDAFPTTDGWRYYITSGAWCYSVPESHLFGVNENKKLAREKFLVATQLNKSSKEA